MTISIRRKKFNRLMNRAKGFWGLYKQNKKGLVGIGLLFFFILFALFGPMLSENHPVSDWDVGGRRVPPTWFKYLPGFQNLVPNLDPIEDVGFGDSDELLVWNIETSSEDSFTVTHSTEGYERGSGPGSILISLNREATGHSAANIKISKIFSWDYSNSPKRFRTNLSFKAEGVEGTRLNIRLVLVDAKREEYVLWQKDITSDTIWSYPEYKVDSYSIKVKMIFPDGVFADPAHIIFNGTGDYEFYFEASFDSIDTESTVTTQLYVDDLNIELMGTSYGLLGTDQWGRDVYSQLAHGAKTSLFVGILTAFISVSIGLIVGLFAGFSGGLIDEVSMRFADMLLVIPFLPLLLILIAILGQSVLNIILVISLLGWMGFSRTVRSQVLSLKERAFIEAARAAGGSTTHIAIRHILPNVMGLVYVSLATSVPAAITAEASLSFLGLGDPSIMSWGQMLHDIVYYAAIKELYWVVPPGLCIALLAVSFVMMGFSLDEILNPRLRRR
jgi:peptide/nickel transport system permease protein